MKKLLVGLLALGSISAFAIETDGIYCGEVSQIKEGSKSFETVGNGRITCNGLNFKMKNVIFNQYLDRRKDKEDRLFLTNIKFSSWGKMKGQLDSKCDDPTYDGNKIVGQSVSDKDSYACLYADKIFGDKYLATGNDISDSIRKIKTLINH